VTKTLGILLYLFIIPPFIATIFSLIVLNIKAFVLNFLAFLLFFGVLYVSKKGFAAEFAYRKATYALAPKRPYKLIATLLLGIATSYSAFFLAHKSPVAAIFLGLIATLGYILWYGLDPKEDKLPKRSDMPYRAALQTLQEADEELARIEKLRNKIRDARLYQEVTKILQKAHAIVEYLQERPWMVHRVRKHLVVYIESMGDVARTYVGIQENLSSQKRAELIELMESLQRSFDEKMVELKKSGEEFLDIKMETLQMQLKKDR